MNLLEYQGKAYFAKYSIPVSKSKVVTALEEAISAAKGIGYPVVVKAQVAVGGRGKAGGVKIANDESELIENFNSILGLNIKGHLVDRVLIERSSDILEEYYASILPDRAKRCYLFMLSKEGGVDIEEVADRNPDAIKKLYVDPAKELDEKELLAFVKSANLNEVAIPQVVELFKKLYKCFVDGDAELVEINPLILNSQNKIHALDAKVTLDDDARFRHPEWDEIDFVPEGDERDRLAKSKGLNYVGLDGYVGVIANGAGLAMSTCDVVNQVGGAPANFLDIGGGANAKVMADALYVINSDEKVKSVLVNIFGGIVRCDEVANGILEARKQVSINSPIVVRLDGTNAEIAKEILAPHLDENLSFEPTMMSGAKKAVELAKLRLEKGL